MPDFPDPANLEIAQFVRDMRRFIAWTFITMGIPSGPNGEPLEEFAGKTLGTLMEQVQGNRGPNSPITRDDLKLLQSAVAYWHQRMTALSDETSDPSTPQPGPGA